MKIAVLNFSGNVGKSTISRYLLQRHMQTEVFSVESINKSLFSDTEVTKLKAKQFSALQQAMLLNDSLIVDIGSSNIEELLVQMTSYSGSQHDFDYFLIPTIPMDKQIVDTLNTIGTLMQEFNIEAKRIKVVFNQVKNVEDIGFDFEKIISLFQKMKLKNNVATLFFTDYYNKIDTLVNDVTYKNKFKSKLLDMDFMADSVDLFQAELTEVRNQYKAETDTEKKEKLHNTMKEIAQLIQLSRLSVTVRQNVDDAYQVLF